MIKTSKKSLKIKIASVNKQASFDDSVVFAAACYTALVDPSTLVYDQGSIRKHLELCLDGRNLEQFPSIRPKEAERVELTQLMLTAFVDYQRMVAR